MKTLLFVDDDNDLLAINTKYFKRMNYNVIYTSDTSSVTTLIKSTPIDCIILDIMMPEVSGFEVCKMIRETSDIPIIFLSGLANEDEKVQGLLLGGDDYMVKPYGFKELEARIQVQLRKQRRASQSNEIILSDMKLDLKSHKVYWNQEELGLSNNEFTFLRLICSTPNDIVTFEMIGKAIWDNYLTDDRKTIMVIASRLRKKIKSYTGRDNLIETVRSKGYKYIHRS